MHFDVSQTGTLLFVPVSARTDAMATRLIDVARDGRPSAISDIAGMSWYPRFSPDGHWIAYVSNKSGRNEIYARPYPGRGGEVTMSASGGQEPAWDPSGKELFCRHDGQMWGVRVVANATSLTVSPPTRLFADPYRLDIGGTAGGVANYDVSPDGTRFVMVEDVRPANDAAASSVRLNVVLNWFEELKRVPPPK